MESFNQQNLQVFSSKVAIITTLTYFILVFISVEAQMNGQVSTPCTASMISTFTPCMNYITGSSAGGGSSTPSSNCCDALKSVMSTSMDCACLIVTASVPLPLIVNRTLALGLPRICKAAGVPIKCQATGSPLPAPGPVQFGAPAEGPAPSSGFSPQPQASKATAATPASQPTATALTPVEAPSRTPRIRPVLTPSSDSPSASTMPSPSPTAIWTFILMGFLLFKL